MLREAFTWAGTNFHHRASVKCQRNESGKIIDVGGVDCAVFIAESFNCVVDRRPSPSQATCPICHSLKRAVRELESELDRDTEPHTVCRNDDWHSLLSVRPYADQWHLHRDDELYLHDLKQQGFVEIDREQKRAGDVIVARVGHQYSHGAIIFGWPCAQCVLDYPRINRESHGCVIQAESRKAGKVTRVHDIEKNWYFQMNPVKFFRWGPWHV